MSQERSRSRSVADAPETSAAGAAASNASRVTAPSAGQAEASGSSATAGNGEEASDARQADGDNSDGEDEEEEYEIAKIINHEPGIFNEGEMAYFVSWVGYGSEADSWVKEEDAENAADMLSDYWRSKGPTKSIRQISKFADQVWKKLEEERAARKRARTSQSQEASQASVKGKGKARASRSLRDRALGSEEDEADNVDMSTLNQAEKDALLKKRAHRKYAKVADWHDLVEAVDTVERNDEGRLIAYVRFKDGARLAYDSAVVNHRCPQKIIALYESKLRWLPPARDTEPTPAPAQDREVETTLSGMPNAAPGTGKQNESARSSALAAETNESGSLPATASQPPISTEQVTADPGSKAAPSTEQDADRDVVESSTAVQSDVAATSDKAHESSVAKKASVANEGNGQAETNPAVPNGTSQGEDAATNPT